MTNVHVRTRHFKKITKARAPDRVSEIVASGEGQAYDPGTGKPMKNWVLIPETHRDLWVKYCEEANDFLKK